MVGPIKGGILSNKLKSRSDSQTDNTLLTSSLGEKDGTWDQLIGDDSRGTRRNRKIKKC